MKLFSAQAWWLIAVLTLNLGCGLSGSNETALTSVEDVSEMRRLDPIVLTYFPDVAALADYRGVTGLDRPLGQRQEMFVALLGNSSDGRSIASAPGVGRREMAYWQVLLPLFGVGGKGALLVEAIFWSTALSVASRPVRIRLTWDPPEGRRGASILSPFTSETYVTNPDDLGPALVRLGSDPAEIRQRVFGARVEHSPESVLIQAVIIGVLTQPMGMLGFGKKKKKLPPRRGGPSDSVDPWDVPAMPPDGNTWPDDSLSDASGTEPPTAPEWGETGLEDLPPPDDPDLDIDIEGLDGMDADFGPQG